MKISNILLVFLSCIVLISCNDNGNNPKSPKKEIMPLAVGNYWRYDVYNYHAYKPDSLSKPDTLTMRITAKLTIANEDWYKCTINSKQNIFFTNRDDGLWMITTKDTINVKADSVRLLYRYPAVLNDVTNGIKTAELSVQKYSYDCIRYINTSDPRFYKTNGIYMSPGVGMVEQDFVTMIQEWQGVIDTICIKHKLVDFSLK